mgnify:CR=1 FL=1
MAKKDSLTEHLKTHFGFDTFKGNQKAIIENVLAGNDTFVLMPTGGGKSLCYQLPSIMMEGTAIVISPLIALMKNQVDAMRNFSEEDGVAHFINSSLNKSAIDQVKADIMAGRTKLLYVAPESLTKEENVEFLRNVNISFYAVDEAHCISEWGHDFRPEYRRIRPIINEIGKRPLIALTATATPKVQHDIQKNLGMIDASVFKSSFNRSNLYYEVRPKDENVDREIIKYIKANEGKSGIVYCLSRKKVEEFADILKANGITDLPSMENYARTYYGSEDLGNYKSKNNPLNRFIAYHMLNRQMATNSFLYTGETTNPDYADERTEYYETMYTYRLIKIKAGNRLNAKNSDNTSLRVIEKESNVDAINGFIHTLDGILVYDEDVMEKDVLHERIRFDFFACIPHLTNNNIRWKCYGSTRPEGTNGYTVTPEFCGEYFTYNDAGVCVFQADDAWADFQGDELVMQESYDFTLRMIPLPPGDYEMRIGYNSGGTRGMGQMYVDGNIAGTPVDLRINGDDPRVGWVKDSETNDDGVENDKMMRNRGYMKAPEALWYWHGGWDNVPMRDVSFALRYIVGQFHFEEYGAHTFRARSVDFKGRGFQLDYIEFIPTDMIRDEGRD